MIEYLKHLSFSVEARKVFNEAKNIYKYYHSQNNSFVNASFYDIREYFQGHDNKGKMNSSSEDKTYCELLNNFKDEILSDAEKYRIRKKSISHDKLSKKLKSHYDLFHYCDEKPAIVAFWYACWNMFWGVLKKKKYEKNFYKLHTL